ncbi:mechanosensitive ion channel family protein [Draconibacterium sp.]|nr:mechanosensitive ion channel family protein [Draconibacterium sp.]
MKFNIEYWATVVGILVIAYILSFILRKILARAIRKKSEHLKEDPTKFVFLKNSVFFIIFTIAVIVIFLLTPGLNDVGKGLFAGAGILAATIGFASQKVFSNILSGIFILIFRPFSVLDTIELRSDLLKGVVEEITLRHTVIRDYENRRIIIPNSVISDTILINSSIVEEKIKKHIEFGISYDSDIDLAKKIIQEEILKHPLFIDNRNEVEKQKTPPQVTIRLIGLTDFSVNIRAYVWTNSNDDAFVLQCDVFESVKKRFDKEGIEIPFPYRTIVFKDKKDSKGEGRNNL